MHNKGCQLAIKAGQISYILNLAKKLGSLAIFSKSGIKFRILALTLNFHINLTVRNNFIVDGTAKKLAFFVSKIHLVFLAN